MRGYRIEHTNPHDLISQIEVLLDDTVIFKECVPATPNGSLDDEEEHADKDDDFASNNDGGSMKASTSKNDDDYSSKALSMSTSNSTGRDGKTSRTISASRRWAGWTARTIILDLPMFVIVALYGGILWLDHVHDCYLFPQIQASIFNDDRREEESTYYTRSCDERDISTTNSVELFLPANATPHEAYLHQLKHGFTIFRSALSPETATNLRDYVVSKNYKLPQEESIFVIENDKRYSFGLGTEEPAVAAAVMELTNSRQLQESIAKIMGPDPALIEMTAITVSYGAIEQYWHDDVFAVSSTVRYARTFAPSYSLFIQLQNTTKEMGVTAACPGTIYCSDGTTATLCEEKGFQLVNGEDGHWAVGDALLMNMNSFHRGGAHTDPNAPDRVMFILTFTTKPRSHAETRQLSQGITFSLRWDMWGHVWSDLQKADTIMIQPWTIMRSLGLYNPRGAAAWGMDYISGAIMRTANSDNGFSGWDLGELLDRGGLRYIPASLQEPMDDDWDEDDDLLWHKFLHGTFTRIKGFWTCLAVISPLVYLLVSSALGTFRGQQFKRSFWQATHRLAFMCTMVYTLLLVSRRHVDSTPWAKDIRADRRFSNSFGNEAAFLDSTGCITSAFPHRNDILMDNRLGSSYLHMYEDFIALGHPGNRVHTQMVEGAASFYAAYTAGSLFRKATAQYIVDTIAINNHGRFLKQGRSGSWCWADQTTALYYTTKMLASASNPSLGVVLKEIQHGISEYRFGIYRNSSLASKHAAPFLRTLEAKLLIDYTTPTATPVTKATSPIRPGTILDFNHDVNVSKRAGSFYPKFKPSPPHKGLTVNKATLSRTLSSFQIVPTEPEPGAWIGGLSRVEGVVGEHWYVGTISFVTAHGMYFVEYTDGVGELVDRSYIRPIVPHQVGQKLEVLIDNENDLYYDCMIISMGGNETYNAYVHELNKYMDNVDHSRFRRRVKEGEIEEESHEYVRKYN